MKIDQALIGSKIGVFSDTRVGSREATAARASGVETEGVPGVVVTVSDDLATDGGRLRKPEPTAAGLFGILASPQSFAVTRPLSITQSAKAGETLRTSSLVNVSSQEERVGRGLGAVGNTADPLLGANLFERAGGESREVRVLRGETVADAITSGVQLSRSFVELPAQGLANDQQGTPFSLNAGLTEQFGPKPVSADGFGPLVSSLNTEQQVGIPTVEGPLGSQMLSPAGDNELARLGLDPPGPDTIGLGSLGDTEGQRLATGLEPPRLDGDVREPVESLTGVGIPREAERVQQTEETASRENELELSKAEEKVVQELRARDREVREHEQAHVSSAGGLAGSPTYSYTTGPDNVQYAVGGEVSIDMSPGGSPEETIDKARTVQRAALAPSEPSAQDRAVAAAASRMELDAQVELREQRVEEAEQTADAANSSGELSNMGVEAAATTGLQNGERSVVQGTTESFEPSPTSLPTEEATVREVNETVRPSLNSEAFQELRTFREREEDVVEVRAGASQRGVADYQRSENAYQAQDDYISVA